MMNSYMSEAYGIDRSEEEVSLAIKKSVDMLQEVDLDEKHKSVLDLKNHSPISNFKTRSSGKYQVKHGVISKQCPVMPLLWQDRFFILKADGSMHYYLSEDAYNEGDQEKGVIQLNDLQKNEQSENGVFDSIQFYGDRINLHVYSKNGRVYKLRFASLDLAKEWKDAIFSHIPHQMALVGGKNFRDVL